MIVVWMQINQTQLKRSNCAETQQSSGVITQRGWQLNWETTIVQVYCAAMHWCVMSMMPGAKCLSCSDSGSEPGDAIRSLDFDMSRWTCGRQTQCDASLPLTRWRTPSAPHNYTTTTTTIMDCAVTLAHSFKTVTDRRTIQLISEQATEDKMATAAVMHFVSRILTKFVADVLISLTFGIFWRTTIAPKWSSIWTSLMT